MQLKKIWLSPPHLSGTEIEFIQQALQNNWVSPYGENIDAFERQLEEYFDVPDVLLVNSGTSAIHLSLIAAGIQAGDEVIVPTLNFAGCINPILYLNAIPLFVDSEKDTFNMDPALAEEVILKRIQAGKKPKAIIGVHLFGTPCKLDELRYLSRTYDITLIEDAADAMGSLYSGKPVGSIGDLGIISFNGNKVITTSGGGALISKDPRHIALARHLSNQASQRKPHYIHDQVGYNYLMSNILAGIGRGQMEVLQDRLKRRRDIFNIYKQELADIECLEFREDIPESASNRWLSVVLVHTTPQCPLNRDDLYFHLDNQQIESRPVWTPMHMQPAFHQYPFYGGNVAEELFQEGLCLPSGSSMTDAQLEMVIENIRDLYRSYRKVNPGAVVVKS